MVFLSETEKTVRAIVQKRQWTKDNPEKVKASSNKWRKKYRATPEGNRILRSKGKLYWAKIKLDPVRLAHRNETRRRTKYRRLKLSFTKNINE